MMNVRKINDSLPPPSFLCFLILSYSMVIVLANWFDVRLIRLFSFDTDAGTLIFPLTFILSDLITEVYGYQQARRAIWCGLLFNMIFILYGQIVIHLPSPDYALLSNNKFDEIQSMNIRVIIASTISYLCAEPLNSLVMAKLKIRYSGNKLAIRFIASTCIASAVDSFIFGTLAFCGLMNYDHLLHFITNMWFLKIMIEVIGLPLSLHLTKQLKQTERLDIYDIKTNFNLFRLKIDYTEQNNQYRTMSASSQSIEAIP
ncbi:queuosine precursor transporter [Legionella maioricensis]|uniref:Probable queuosine precursor transporter n=1 Tax=Legionella maioricensis TaxID=2896528 RepID=A0A9X2CYV7_9GAMM|nr:queuosine precursor transporter [Legionella maioricensis]MCL9683237.1 queuosine precursor transporter [Legionella maioricensis]MCL9686065.1 queuosine precursor transporter [Legionella maioricensis]